MNAAVSNNRRKYRASRPDGVGSLSKGNHFSTGTAPGAPKDTQRPFTGQFPYKVRPYVEVEGIFFDIVPAARKATRAPKPERPARKARSRRQDPGAGIRPSLSAMRAKG